MTAKGAYFALNSENIVCENFRLTGGYCFDGVKNLVIRNAEINTKDAFWNSKNVTVYDSYISGEYLGWNAENLTLVNCTIESLQGMCYIKNLKLVNCKLVNTTLAFEYSTVDADICGGVDSVLNPSGGIIRAGRIGELIIEPDRSTPKRRSLSARRRHEVQFRRAYGQKKHIFLEVGRGRKRTAHVGRGYGL